MAINLTSITHYLLDQSWQIAILVGVVATVNLALRNKSAHIRYLLWMIVVAKCLVPPLHPIPLAILPQQERIKPAPMTSTEPIRTAQREVTDTKNTDPAEPIQPLTEAAIPPSINATRRNLTIHEWLGMTWIIGTCVFLTFNLLRAIRADIWLWRRRQALPVELLSNINKLFAAHGIRRFPNVWLVEGFNQPFVWGLVRGSIYLPVDFLKINKPEHQRSVLGHELSHVLRCDAAVNILQVIAQALFWFHPLIWWTNRKIRQEREKCCDEMAVARLNTSPRDYSTAIIETLSARHEQTRPVPSLAVAGPVKNIEERIKTMLRPGKKFYKNPSLIAAAAVLLIGFFTVPTALVLSTRAEAKSSINPGEEQETLGKLEYVDHITRGDLLGVASIEASSDGRYVYAAAYPNGALVVFERDSNSGYLKHIQTISDNMSGTVSARVSPSGKYVLSTAIYTHTVRLFERSQSAGTLKLLDNVQNGKNGIQNLEWPVDGVFSRDSRFVYIISPNSKSVTVFRITDDVKLAFVESAQGQDNCFDGARGIAIDPRDKYLYVTSCKANTLAVLERDPQTGKINLVQVIKDEQDGVHGLGGVFSAACSPDGQFVYTSSGRFNGDSAVCVFKKMSDGKLSLVQELFDGQEGLVGFLGGNELQVSPDGQNLYAVGSRSNTVVAFRRNTESGKLTYLQTLHDKTFAGNGGSASGIGICPDGEYVYVAGEQDNSVLVFKRLAGTRQEPSEALHRAAFLGDTDQAKSLIAGKADLNKTAERGYAALHWAVKAGHRDIAELLIANGADIDAKTNTIGWTVLHMAIMQSDKELAQWLISKGADINAANQNNALTPLFIATMGAKTDLVEFLINNGAKIDARDTVQSTPLHYAASNGDAATAELLLSKEADLNAKTASGDTPLHYACIYDHLAVVRLLVEKGADVNGKGQYGLTPLLYAVNYGHNDITEFLASKGADVNIKFGPGFTPLYVAIMQENKDLVKLLISKSTDVNIVTDGLTALQMVVYRGWRDIVEQLIAKGADVNVTGQGGEGWTPLHFAGDPEIIRLLLANGADINATNNNKRTPLHTACMQGWKDAIEPLIAGGADINAKDKWDRTPLSVAKEHGYNEIVELLREHGGVE